MTAETVSIVDAALALLRRGRMPVRVPFRTKGPTDPEWQKKRLTEDEMPSYFGGQRWNLGYQTGEPSGNLVTIDIDCDEAMAIADYVLPSTGSEHGREGSPRSHRDYQLPASLKTEKFSDPLTATRED